MQELLHNLLTRAALIAGRLVQITAADAVNRSQHIIERMALRNLFIRLRSMRLHAYLNADERLIASQRHKACKIFIYIKSESIRIRGIVIIPMLRNSKANALLRRRSQRILKLHLTVTGVITVHMCIIYH